MTMYEIIEGLGVMGRVLILFGILIIVIGYLAFQFSYDFEWIINKLKSLIRTIKKVN